MYPKSLAPVTLELIESQCADLADFRARLRKKFEAKQKAINAINAEHDATIRDLQIECNIMRAALITSLESGRELFKKPKSYTFHNITVGFEKSRTTLNIPPEDILVKRIETMLPAPQAETVLDRSVSIIKAAFKKLPLETLQKLGCSKTTGADQPIIHANDDDIEALVTKSLGQQAEPATPMASGGLTA